jgi:hypothetical protein
MKDNETLKEFKDRIYKQILTIDPKAAEPDIYIEGYREG